MKMDISPTVPSAAMGWRSYCVATIAAAGWSVHLFLTFQFIHPEPRVFLGLIVSPPLLSSVLLFLYICRTFCEDCLNILVGPGTFGSLKPLDPWICYLCQPHRPHGALIPREDWSIRVQELFANNSAMEFVSDQLIFISFIFVQTHLLSEYHSIFSVY